jgi:iron complex transport system permease protein
MPHLSRRVLGADARFALPGAMLFGAIVVLICDNVSRVLLAEEIPLGIITSLIGASFFMFIMMSRAKTVKR